MSLLVFCVSVCLSTFCFRNMGQHNQRHLSFNGTVRHRCYVAHSLILATVKLALALDSA